LNPAHQEWHQGSSSPRRCNRGSYLPGSHSGTTNRQHPTGVQQNAHLLGISCFRSKLSSHRPRHWHRSVVGGNIQLPANVRLHARPHLIPQPACRRGHGNEALWRIGQHDHESWEMDIANVPHPHALADWYTHGRACMADVHGVHLPECGMSMTKCTGKFVDSGLAGWVFNRFMSWRSRESSP
jgi:hypothetical protein